MFRLVLSQKVKNDFINISDFISKDNPIYAIKTINSIIETIDLLLLFPFIWKDLGDDLREIVESKYKYKIVYKIDDNIITVLSVYKYQNSWE